MTFSPNVCKFRRPCRYIFADFLCNREEPPITIREAGIIKEGFSKEADELRRAKTEGKEWLAQLEAREKEATGIKNLKVKYNKVFGYYLEVTNSFKDLVPADWVRKQTLTNAERYTTDELKKLEDVILGAEDKLCSLEYDFLTKSVTALPPKYAVSNPLPARLRKLMSIRHFPLSHSSTTM